MRLLFWRWLHRKLEQWWHWVYWHKIWPVDGPELARLAEQQRNTIYKSRVVSEARNRGRTTPCKGDRGGM